MNVKTKPVANWYHWDQILKMTLTRQDAKSPLTIQVTLKPTSKPWPRPEGITTYYVNVQEGGYVDMGPDVNDEILCHLFDEFKAYQKFLA